MKLLLLIGLCALAVARLPSSSWEQEYFSGHDVQEDVFRPGKEYKFRYNGQLASGIPQSSRQHSATRIQALVSVVFKQRQTCILEIQRVRVGRLNRRIPSPRQMIPFQAFEEVEIEGEMEETLKEPVKFLYNKGMISDVVFAGKEQTWSANIKRGILNMLQVNLQKVGQVDLTEEARLTNRPPKTETPELDFYSVMENTLEGQCETLYTINSNPNPRYSSGPVLNVTKSIDFEKCQRRPDIKYNWRFGDPCPTCEPKYTEDQKFLKASTVAKYQIAGNQENFLIEKACVESQYNFVPFNRKGNMMTTYVNQTLVLFRTSNAPRNAQGPQNPQESDSDMIYSPDWDIAKEELFMEGQGRFLKDSPYSELKNKVNFVKNILRSLINDMTDSVQKEAPRQYLRLVKILRMLKLNQIQEIHKTFYKQADDFTPEQHLKIKDILVDALADAGTKDCIKHLVSKIKSKQIKPLKAALSIKHLINTRVVSQEMIEELMSLAESEVCRRNFFLKQSVYLTMGSMVNALCQPNKDKLAKEFKVRPQQFCPRKFQKELVEKIFNKYKNAQRKPEKLIYMKCIDNMGLEMSVFELEKIIKNVEGTESPHMRIQAILALRQIRHTMPRKVRSICMPIYMSRRQPTDVRIACASVVLRTLPPRPILDQIARSLYTERNQQVASFVYTYMITMANSTNPCYKKTALDLQLSLRHGKRISGSFTSPGLSKYIHSGFYSKNARMGAHVNFGYTFTPSSYLPQWFGADLTLHQLGQWNNHLFSVGVAQRNLDSLLQKYLGSRGYWSEMDLEDILVRNPRSSSTRSPKILLQKMWQKLKTVARSLPQSPEGYIYLKYKDQDFGFLPFSTDEFTESLSEIISEGKINLKVIEEFLESGYQFHLYKAALLHEMSYKIPTTLGMPLVLSVEVPTVMQLTGQLKAKISNRWQKFKVELVNAKPSMVTTLVVDMQCWSPMTNAGLKVVGFSKVYTPINGEVELDLNSAPAELVARYEPPRRPVKWIQLETRPSTYTRVWPKFIKSWQEPEEKTIRGEEWTRQYNFDQDFPRINKFEQFCEESLGVRLQVKGTWHHTPVMRHSNTPFCPLSGPNQFTIRTAPTQQQPRKIVAKITSSMFERQDTALSFNSQIEKFLESSSSEQSSEQSSEESSEESMEKEWNQYRPSSHHQSTINAEIKTVGGKNLKAEFEAKVQCDSKLRICKYNSKFERSPVPEYDPQPFKMCVESEYLLPRSPRSLSQIRGKKVVGTFKTTWGRNCNRQNYVKLQMVAQQSRKMRQMIQEDPEFLRFSEQNCQNQPERCSHINQYRTLVKASRLNQLDIQAEYQNVSPGVKNITSKLYRAIKHYLYWNSQVNNIQVLNPRSQIKIRMTLDPRTRKHLNVTVKSPQEKAIFTDLPLPLPIRSYSTKQSTYEFNNWEDVTMSMDRQVSPVCKVNSLNIDTFDNVNYQVPISTCWSVLAKDCQKENFVVLMKKLSQTSSLKKVKVISPYHEIIVEPETSSSSSELRVKVNGEEVQVQTEQVKILRNHNHHVARIHRNPASENSIKVELPEQGVRVYFDGYTAAIRLSPLYHNLQCGLCGHYDNDQENEWRNPENELEYDVRNFYKKFTLREQQCQYLEELSQICPTPYCEVQNRYEQYPNSESRESQSQESSTSQEQESSSSEESSSWQRRSSYQPIQQTKVIEQNGKICFSRTPVPSCPHHTYPSQHLKARKVVYSCISMDEPEADEILTQIRSQRSPAKIQSIEESFHELEQQPQSCQRMHL